MTHTYDILGLGNAIMDLLAFASDEFLDEESMAKGRMMLIDEARALNLHTLMQDAKRVPGGSVANTLVAMADLGARTSFVGKLRDDALGKSYRHGMVAAGVHFPTPEQHFGPSTACCYILVTPDGQRTMNTYLGVCSEVSEGDVREADVAASAILYIEGYLWDQPAAKAAIRRAMQAAKAAGRQVALSLSDAFCIERHRADFLELIEGEVDILFANEAEIQSLCMEQDFERCIERMRGKLALVALTRSEHGSVLITPERRLDIAPVPVKEVIDTTGAGDLYAAGVLYGLSQGWELEACGHLGSKLAAQIIQQIGARSKMSLKGLLAA